MSVKTRNISDCFAKIDHALDLADKKRSFDYGLSLAKEVMGLLGIENAPADLKSFPRLKTNPSWTKNASDYEDRKASYVLAENNNRNIDFKLFWVNKPAKRVISNLVALTPNFEDEPFYANKSVGIDFVLSENANRLIIVLSNNYKIRILEIHKELSNTQKKIFEKWTQDLDFSNKPQVHKILWDSFDIKPLNEEFYIEISSLFNELVQHLDKKNVLDKKHRSQFVNRLIGRIIFCWFLRKKEIISEDAGYFDAQGRSATEYYQDKLETLFFKALNTPVEERSIGIDNKTPFLNGGLFEPKESDLFGKDELSFPDNYFERFYKFLGHYNFTTDESTSDFQQVAIDPEMLGRIFENLLAEEIEETGEQARKAKGAFYTPREIVDYMCRESLRAYVSEKLGDDGRRVEILQILFDKKEHELDSNILVKLGTHKSRIIEILDEIKIIDPACGSGAFPIGMLQIMLSIYERLDTRLDQYKTKLGIIRNNIFGVDIEPMAVEISRLRTWLSLIVDAVIKPSEKNKGIEELPNLDFKFVCANSLIPLEQEEGLFDNKQMAEQMQASRDRYFKTNSLRIKDKMKRDFEEIVKKNRSMFASEKQRQLLTYHPFDSDNVCSFFDGAFMFGVSVFDVVIANPPYGSNLSDSEKEYLKRRYSHLVERIRNSFLYFMGLADNIVKPNGIVSFIMPNEFLFQIYMTKARTYFLQHSQILYAINIGESVFEAIVPVCLFSFKKLDIQEYQMPVADLRHCSISELPYRLRSGFADAMSSKQTVLSTPNCIFAFEHKKIQLVNKLAQSFKPFEYFCDDIANGISTSCDSLYIVNKDNAKELKLEKPYLKPCIRGGQFNRFYCPMDTGDRLLYITNDFDRDQAVNVERYLLSHKKKLIEKCVEKKSSSREWHVLFRSRYPELFISPKIMIRQTADKIIAAADNDVNYYCIDSVNVALLKDEYRPEIGYFVGLLNSRLLNLFYSQIAQEAGRVLAQVKPQRIKMLPIVLPSKDKRQRLTLLVSRITQLVVANKGDSKIGKDKELDNLRDQLDEQVMDIYGLMPEEKEIVRNS